MSIKVKKLIVNADDFGLTSEINEGIIQTFKNGIVTSTSLMATGEGFSEAIQLIKNNPSLDVGVHLTLIEEKPLLSRQVIPTLVDDVGNFRKNARQFFFDYLRNKISMKEIKTEFCAQIEKLCDAGIKITHIDSHQHIHMLPKILEIVIELAEGKGIKYIRCPKERIELGNIFFLRKIPRLLQQITLNFFCFYSRKRIKEYAVDHFFGFYYGGHLGKKQLLKIFAKQSDGISEIMCHPGSRCDGKTWVKYSHWYYNWHEELNCLLDKDISNLIKQQGIQLISFSEINDKQISF